MAAAHNTFIQGLNAVIRHGPTVKEDKVEPFMWFCLALVRHGQASSCYIPHSSFSFCTFQLDGIHHHHTLEETFYFPAMEEKLGKGALSGNIKEHEEFIPKLEALDEWCKKVQKGEVVYDGTVFLGMVDAFADTMVAHMTHVRSIFFLQFI
jgi:Hemerythrin HHE cation binding domain